MKRQQFMLLAFICGSFLAASVFLLRLFPLIQIRENSMSPTLRSGDLAILNRSAYIFGEIQVGDVLVFRRHLSHAPGKMMGEMTGRVINKTTDNARERTGQTPAAQHPLTEELSLFMIKRCALAPQTPLQWRNSRLFIPSLNSYVKIRKEVRNSLDGLTKVPEGFVFVLGDNTDHSVDSRNYGLVPVSEIQGKALWLSAKPDM
ncbi:signal peptidase I [Candidatus Haliotispira prima]|uniref:Signal peptidase I n=1 Tax=Candidatus Haliotispira prima TaxID=3034016 RepID=A0ABY8MFN1_9SPIO|nr:signal peptidase I [Candidatus Haliotispira prima]